MQLSYNELQCVFLVIQNIQHFNTYVTYKTQQLNIILLLDENQ